MSTAQVLLFGIYKAAGITAATANSPGTSVATSASRAGTGLGVFYQFAQHTMIWCDPDAAHVVNDLVGPTATPEADVRVFAAENGLEIAGASVMKTVGTLVSNPVPDGYSVRVMDWSRAEDVAAMQRLVDSSSEEDLDESEMDMDDLDDAAVALVDGLGDIAAFAGMRSFDLAPTLGDIGVIVREADRRKGLGAVVVAQLVENATPEGWDALYRCDPYDNPGSDRLSANAGFEPITDLVALRLLPAND